MKTPIADAFREWEKKASKEEKDEFCKIANTLVEVLKFRDKMTEGN